MVLTTVMSILTTTLESSIVANSFFPFMAHTEIFDIVFDDDLWSIIFVSLYAATKILYNYMLLREGVTLFCLGLNTI